MDEPTRLIERAAMKWSEVTVQTSRQTAAEPVEEYEPPPTHPTSKHSTNRTITLVDSLRLARVALPNSELSRAREEFRLLKSGLVNQIAKQAKQNPAGRIIMVTSARPREGKTFTSANLAVALASGKDFNVILIDVDANRYSLTEQLGLSSNEGLSDVLIRQARLDDVLIRTSIPTLSIVPSGPLTPYSADLIASMQMNEATIDIARRDPNAVVLIDAPPCLLSSNAPLLAAHVGQIVFVVEAHRTQREEIEAALRLLNDCPRISLVLNKGPLGSKARFGGYSYRDRRPSAFKAVVERCQRRLWQ